MKVDLCTWTKNGAKTLIPVLKSIDRVIPIEGVGEKIAVDDSGVNSTAEILNAGALKGLKLALETKEPKGQLLYVLRKLALAYAFFQKKQRRLYNLKIQN